MPTKKIPGRAGTFGPVDTFTKYPYSSCTVFICFSCVLLCSYIGNLFNPSLRAEHLHEFFAKPQYLSASGTPVASGAATCGPPRSIFEMPWKQKEALLQMGKSVGEAADGGALTRNKIKQGTFFERWQNFLTIIYSSRYAPILNTTDTRYIRGTVHLYSTSTVNLDCCQYSYTLVSKLCIIHVWCM